jgi:hypothetical protein
MMPKTLLEMAEFAPAFERLSEADDLRHFTGPACVFVLIFIKADHGVRANVAGYVGFFGESTGRSASPRRGIAASLTFDAWHRLTDRAPNNHFSPKFTPVLYDYVRASA